MWNYASDFLFCLFKVFRMVFAVMPWKNNFGFPEEFQIPWMIQKRLFSKVCVDFSTFRVIYCVKFTIIVMIVMIIIMNPSSDLLFLGVESVLFGLHGERVWPEPSLITEREFSAAAINPGEACLLLLSVCAGGQLSVMRSLKRDWFRLIFTISSRAAISPAAHWARGRLSRFAP